MRHTMGTYFIAPVPTQSASTSRPISIHCRARICNCYLVPLQAAEGQRRGKLKRDAPVLRGWH